MAATLKAATVVTDQGDYPPGATAIITGNGFAPGEKVTFKVSHGNSAGEVAGWNASANASGGLSTSWAVCSAECQEPILDLVAIGSSGTVAAAKISHGSTGLLRLVNVTSGGSCVYGPTGPGVQHWDVQAGGTYTLTFSFPSKTSFDSCLGSSLPSTLSMVV